MHKRGWCIFAAGVLGLAVLSQAAQPLPAPRQSIAVIDMDKLYEQSGFRELEQKLRADFAEVEQAIVDGTKNEADYQRLVYPYIRSYTPWEYQGKRTEWLLSNARQMFANRHFHLDQSFRAALQPILREIAEQQKLDVVFNLRSVTPHAGKSEQSALSGTTIIFQESSLDITELVIQRLRERDEKLRRENETKRQPTSTGG